MPREMGEGKIRCCILLVVGEGERAEGGCERDEREMKGQNREE